MILLEVEGVAYNEAYPTQDFFLILKVYSKISLFCPSGSS